MLYYNQFPMSENNCSMVDLIASRVIPVKRDIPAINPKISFMQVVS